MSVVRAQSREDAIAKGLRIEPELDTCAGQLLGVEDTDDLSFAEDQWAMTLLEEHLFARRGGGVAITDGRSLDDLDEDENEC